jgi:shikimate kinase
MGCGKTTAAKKTASKLNYKFIDLDSLIEDVYNMPIAEIFSKKGENTFRKIEKEILHKTFNLSNTVISTGGGAPCFFDNMEQMNNNGITIYIKLSPKTLFDRLKNAKTERPLIKNLSDKELFDFIERAIAEREPFYNKAQITVNGINLTPEIIINKINS